MEIKFLSVFYLYCCCVLLSVAVTSSTTITSGARISTSATDDGQVAPETRQVGSFSNGLRNPSGGGRPAAPSISPSAPSLGSVLGSLWSSITTTSKDPNCPGTCFNALASFLCDEVDPSPSACVKSDERCCVDRTTTNASKPLDVAPATTSSTPVPTTRRQQQANTRIITPMTTTTATTTTEGVTSSSSAAATPTSAKVTTKRPVPSTTTRRSSSAVTTKRPATTKKPVVVTTTSKRPSTSATTAVVTTAARTTSTTTEPSTTTTTTTTTTRIPTSAASTAVASGTVAPLPEKQPEGVPADAAGGVIITRGAITSTGSLTECPGVCVAPSISEYCDAVLTRPGLCKGSLRCCVTREVFEGQDAPKDLVLNESPAVQQQQQQQGSQQKVPSQQQQQSNSNPQPTEYHGPIPAHKRCKGTCVGSFFTFLCDRIDTDSICPSGGQCCLTREDIVKQGPESGPPSSPQQSPGGQGKVKPGCPGRSLGFVLLCGMSEQGCCAWVMPHGHDPTVLSNLNVGSRECVARPECSILARAPHTQSYDAPPEPRCLSVLMSTFCTSPSRLVPETTCEDGTVCCVERPNTSSGAANDRRPPPPQRKKPLPVQRRPPPASSSSTSSALGSKRNAEMTDLFKCERKSVSCCAPKSAIQRLLQEEQAQKHKTSAPVLPPGLIPQKQHLLQQQQHQQVLSGQQLGPQQFVINQPGLLDNQDHLLQQQQQPGHFLPPPIIGSGPDFNNEQGRRPLRPLPPNLQNLPPHYWQNRVPPNAFMLRNESFFPPPQAFGGPAGTGAAGGLGNQGGGLQRRPGPSASVPPPGVPHLRPQPPLSALPPSLLPPPSGAPPRHHLHQQHPAAPPPPLMPSSGGLPQQHQSNNNNKRAFQQQTALCCRLRHRLG
ncbi:unnamed protein product [Notodromas monacha]|uniref:Protein masquerade clip-domain domain-containing protein n=1 Tax=Notodromas monacha TaxID=399045 RepID=A0A7R9BRR8_9CRUS|nr:unnamed protein product [Notodromas monacha]CAG0919099.1 unnamed protein product [Notodromas monacha]